jgi:hypothetical protein
MAAAPQTSISENESTRLQASSPDFDSNRILEEITRSALHATGASGAALVLSDGTLMSCRACSGELAPPVGTRLNSDAGFTATCVQTAKIVRCDDTETDPRVDGSSCVELGIRSILAVPVFNNQNVAGVLEVLSNEPKKFTDRHATALQLLARLVETLFNYGSRGDVTITPDAKPQSDDSGKANRDQATLTCLSCGHPNPRDSQFCNQCGIVLFGFLGPQDTTLDLSLPTSTESSADEGLKEICKIISGDAGLATWSEISERLLADQRGVAAQDKPHPAATEERAKTEDTVLGLGTAPGANGIKARPGAVRRSMWL